MALMRVSKQTTAPLSPLDIEPGYGILIGDNAVSKVTLPDNSTNAISGANWDVLANVTDLSSVNMTGDISTYFQCFGYDETNDSWNLLTPSSRTWDVSQYNYCLIHQTTPSAGAKVYFS